MSIRVNKALYATALSLGLAGTTLITVQPAEAYSRSNVELHLHPGTAVQADSAASTLGGAVAGVATGNITASRIVIMQSGVPITLYGR
ncbi:hypothetical protein [Leptolyngbya sp. FACHB-261]|uniref:hypothetical protein n=1 Tax=Leptolyngbya sp. FACHB-261 TaxID=2692806 RepID=UPI0016824596|nr:hypothetical protein [Leptolyngbya sp. FACHB-261]MBD2100327.1 hypothetical protein [Leptolyngbya sp. FACHB-261]